MAMALVAGLWPMAAQPATHPEGTTVAHPAAADVDRVRIAVLDKVEGRRVIIPFPVGVRIPLPDGLHSLVVERFAADFALTRRPGQKEEGSTEEDPPEAGIPEPQGDNPAALVHLSRDGQPVASSWIFGKAPYLFQPSNMRYNFELLGAKPSRKQQSARSSAG